MTQSACSSHEQYNFLTVPLRAKREKLFEDSLRK